ncbi:hypothetical protein TNCV_2710721 [Trichonephila clavipes]|nr:hypothetical protein TNCV_2710721 [Trichonephila clavipes]
MWTTPELAPPLLTTTPHQREDVSALDRFNVHRSLPYTQGLLWYLARTRDMASHDPIPIPRGSNILESSNIGVKVAGSIAFHHLHC